MKRFGSIYFLLALLIFVLSACSSDDTGESGAGNASSGKSVFVHLRVSAAGLKSSTRAGGWEDSENATDVEMMNVWTVVAVNKSDNKVSEIYACKPDGNPDQEIDNLVELPVGEYRFYSFANMSPKVVMSILNISGTGNASTRTRADQGYPYRSSDEAGGSVTPYSNQTSSADDFMTNDNTYPKNIVFKIAFDSNATLVEADVESKTVNVAGNNFDVTADNGYGSKGIPMSNVQTLKVSEGASIDLIVIRMMAKIQLQLFNERGSDVTVESVTLTDLTKNADNNLKLLPNLTSGANTMDAVHGDLQPNLGSATPADLTISPATEVNATTNSLSSDNPAKITFYVNESRAPSNPYAHFFLKIKLSDESEQRYALITDDNATGYSGSWDYIARNDYRIIPIVLDDYKLDIIPYDFPAIGVYPASVKEEDGLYTINFHDYGHFHLLPVVKKMSDPSAVVPFTETAPTGTYGSTSWGFLTDNSFNSSWGTWTDVNKTATDDGTSFYRTGSESYITTDTDGDEVGGVPKWYANSTAPQWKPTTSSAYAPFIFGYIADPDASLSKDKTIYHEFTINLYKEGMSAPRLMTYRLLMILDTKQMLYGTRSAAATRRSHHSH